MRRASRSQPDRVQPLAVPKRASSKADPLAGDRHDPVLAHLSGADEVLSGLIQRVGPCRMRHDPRRSPFESLVRAVANQQLNGKAAATILERFTDLVPGRKFPSAEQVGGLSDERLRACGFSRAKIASIRDIAAKTLDGTVPGARLITRMSDDEIVARLTEVRGVGRWTVEMLLMFQLGRPDVLPADDFGVRNGFRLVYGRRDMPAPRVVLEHGERWRPYRSTAAWYLWRAVDLDRESA